MPGPIAVDTARAERETAGTIFRFLLGLAFFAVVAAAGYAAFLAFAFAGGALSVYGFLLVAMVAGAGAFFSPCSFPLLPSYFAYANPGARNHPGRVAMNGLAAAAGVVSFNGFLGLLFALAGTGIAESLVLLSPNPSGITLFAGFAVGGALLGLGLVQIAGLTLHGRVVDRALALLERRAVAREPAVRMYLYGFGYTLAGIGCAAPFLATVVVLALAAGGLLPASAAFLVFALTAAGLMVFVSILAATSRARLLERAAERTPTIKKASGLALAAFGAMLIAFTLWPELLRPLFP